MAITTDKARTFRPANISGVRNRPVAAATSIPLGAFVCVNAAGNAVNGADTAALTFVGVAVKAADNSAGSAGDETVDVARLYIEDNVDHDGLTAAAIGSAVYLVDNSEVGLAADTTNTLHVGFLVGIASATKCSVEIRPIPTIVPQGT
jgi:hypothetical protein